MLSRFDRRVVPETAVAFVRACQRRVTSHLGGGSVLSGGWLVHRLSYDLDLFCHDVAQHRELVRVLPDVAREVGVTLTLQRDAGTFVRAELTLPEMALELDVVAEPLADLDAAAEIEGVMVESAADLRAAKLTCILSRSEPRDLVDLLFLERAGFDPLNDLTLAVQKDAGVDPAVLAWLLTQFPVEPLPQMLLPLSTEELRRYRDDLAVRMRRAGVPPAE